MDVATFERCRLAVFARYGFHGKGRWVRDRHGRRTHLIARGQGDHPTVLLHGGLSQAGEWALLAGRLEGPVIVVDRPGCGLSDPVDYRGGDFRAAAADWLVDLLDAVGADRADLVGNSMGGFFAMALATAHPDRVRRLALPGAPAGLDRRLPAFIRLWCAPGLGRLVGAAVRSFDPDAFRRRVLPDLVARPEAVPDDVLEILAAAIALPGADRTGYSMLRSVATPRGWRRHLSMRQPMASSAVPTLLLWGDVDRFAPPSSGRDLVARMSDGRLEIVPNAGHLPHLDQPEAVAAALSQFLGSDGRPPPTTGSDPSSASAGGGHSPP